MEMMNDLHHDIKSEQPFYSDLSFWSLLIANAITIVWAVKKGWSLDTMIWGYFFQNIILGFFWPAKVIGSAIDASYKEKVRSIAFFVPHYFLLHFWYATCLYGHFSKELSVNFKPIIIVAGIFFLSETFSYFVENSVDRQISLAKSQLLPYARVFPMHFVMIIGLFRETANAHFGIIFFLLLKGSADMALYMVERNSLMADVVTASFERYKARGLVDDSNLKEKEKICQFCRKVIGRNKTSRAIKEHEVCEECYNRVKTGFPPSRE